MDKPPTGTWLPKIETARSAAELIRVLREYLESLTPEELARLPAGLRPESLSRGGEIQEWAVTLAHADLKASGAPGANEPLHQAAVVFAAAGARLSKVAE